jgi:hypothetical protein
MPTMTEKYVSNNFRDAAEKMQGVIGNYNGEWVYLSNWQRDRGIAEISFLDFNKLHHKDIVDFSKVDAKDFSFGPYPLGFCVVKGDLYYASRNPVRKNKFGLRDDNIAWHLVASPNKIDGPIRPEPFHGAWREGSLHSMLSNKYNGLKYAVRELQPLKTLFAPISRDFALVRIGLRLSGLFYKTEQVGEVDLTTGSVHLYPSFDHLQERVARNVLET